MVSVVIHEVLAESGLDRESNCLNLHSSTAPDDFSSPGDGYRELIGSTAPGPSRPSFERYPLRPVNGLAQSHPRCFFLRFSPPFGQVSDVRFWITEFTVPAGWTFQVAVSPSLGRRAWRPVTEFMEDPLEIDRRPNLMGGYATRSGAIDTWEPDLNLHAVEVGGLEGFDTPYVSIRAKVTDSATPGPPLGVDVNGFAEAIEWNFAWR